MPSLLIRTSIGSISIKTPDSFATLNRTLANSYDNGWQSAWVSKGQTLYTPTNKTVGKVLFIGDSFTTSSALLNWARLTPDSSNGQTAEDNTTLSWMYAREGWDTPPGDGVVDADNSSGLSLATKNIVAGRTLTAKSGASASDFLVAAPSGSTTSMAAARAWLVDTANTSLPIDVVIKAFSDAQFAIVLFSGAPAGGSVTDLTTICDRLEAASILPILETLPYRYIPGDNAATASYNSTYVDPYNSNIRSLAATRGYPLVDTFAGFNSRQPNVINSPLLQTDGVHPSGNTGIYTTTSSPYMDGGDPTTHTTGDALKNVGYLLRFWLILSKLVQVKTLIADTYSAPTSSSTFTTSDLTMQGMWGVQSTGVNGHELANNNNMFAVRYVSGQRRILMAARDGLAVNPQTWFEGDLFELATPSQFYSTAPNVSDVEVTNKSCQVLHRWPMSAWQTVGVYEVAGGGIHVHSSWWDETNQVLWYTNSLDYSGQPLPCLSAVGLPALGSTPTSPATSTCTRYGPWFYSAQSGIDAWNSEDWKRVCMWLTPIPSGRQAAMGNRTHLMGGCPMSVAAAAHWGLGLIAVNLPTLTPSVFGLAEAYNTGAGTTFKIDTTVMDLTTIPTDGSVILFFGHNNAPSVAPYHTRPTSITKSGSTYTIVGTTSFPSVPSTSKVNWSLCYRMADHGLPIADFSEANSGKTWPNYFMKRPSDYVTVDSIHHPDDDPYIGGRWGQGDYMLGTYGGPVNAVAGTSTTITLPASASSTTGFYNNAFVYFVNNIPTDILGTVRKITAYNGSTKVATVDAPWEITPTSSSQFVIQSANSTKISAFIGQPPNTALPSVIGGQGYWQASMDAAFTCVWVEKSTKQGILQFGRQTYGGTWYKYFDTYKYWGYLDKARSGNDDNGSYGFRATDWRAPLYVWNIQHVLESAAGTRAFNRDGMEPTYGGDWKTAFPAIPIYNPAPYFPTATTFHHNPNTGASQGAFYDSTTNQLLVCHPGLYKHDFSTGRSLIAVYTLPS